ncbi:hypothetical protein MKX03_001082 [Papaver bracteatum]|nr:hypothetical protein MKX03_001082 [Papaver bracteatum]
MFNSNRRLLLNIEGYCLIRFTIISVDVKRALPRTEQQVDRSYQTHGNSSNNSISVSDDVHNNDWFKTEKIFVGGLSTITKEELSNFFGKIGNITDVVVMYDKFTQRARVFGFITFESEESVEKVMQQNHYELNDVSVEVKRAIPRDGNNNSHHSGNGYGTLDGRGYRHDSNSWAGHHFSTGPNHFSTYPLYVPFYPPTGANPMFLPGYGMVPVDRFGGAMPYYNGCNYPSYTVVQPSLPAASQGSCGRLPRVRTGLVAE